MNRRTKKQQKQLISTIESGLALLAFFIYLKTNSLLATLSIIILAVFLMVGISVFNRIRVNQKLAKSGIKEIDKMDGIQFERYLSTLFKKLGYKVQVTRASGDFGADLVLIRENKKIIVQAKRYKSNVGIKAVQEIASAKLHYKATDAWVVTNSFFTNAAVKLAKSNHVHLINRNDLIELILSIKQAS